MEITTKYDIGEELYIVEVFQNQASVSRKKITNINIGGKIFNKYEFYNTSRGESEIYRGFDDAKEKALERQAKINADLIKNIEDVKIVKTR